MTYYKRRMQLMRTLSSFDYADKNYHVVIVDDGSGDEISIPDGRFPVTLIRLDEHEQWRDSSIAFNLGFKFALSLSPDVVVFQNAECMHRGDVLGAAERVGPEEYISFACYSLSKETTDNIYKQPIYPNKQGASNDGEDAWYNHPIYRPVGYHFCAAINADNLRMLNGFDERFSQGIGYDDNYLLHRVRMLGLKITITDWPHVYHQWHYSVPKNRPDLIERNRILYEQLSQEKSYKAVHQYTPDL